MGVALYLALDVPDHDTGYLGLHTVQTSIEIVVPCTCFCVKTPADDIVSYLIAHTSAVLNSRACYSRVDSDWVSIIVHQLGKENGFGSVSNDIVSPCLYHYSCGVDSPILSYL